MNNLSDIQKQLLHLRNERDIQEKYLHDAQQSLIRIDREVEQLERQVANPNMEGRLAALHNERSAIQHGMDSVRKDWLNAKTGAWDSLRNLLELPPWTLVEQLPDHTPFLLLPVKVETKFAKSPSGAPELWVRIFPDTIAVQSHETALMETELEAGRTYWAAIWEVRGETPETQESVKRGAWNVLASGAGPQRAAYIALKTRPLNWSEYGDVDDEPHFPETGPTNASGWTQPPRARVMPDRFVVATFTKRGGSLVQALPPALGRHVPDALALGPDPSQLEGNFGRDDETGELITDPGMAWLTDFEKAVEVGMGLKIPLAQPFDTAGFDRVLVLGLRLSTGAAESAGLLEELFESHRFTDGLAFVPQGMPTNNSEGAAPGFSTYDPTNEQSYLAMANAARPSDWAALYDYGSKKDGQRFAEALGLDYGSVAPIENANREDVAEAIAMNAALWPATWGHHLKDMLGEAFSTDDIERTERFFLENITGRGLLPAIRAGNQPYGLLLTSAFDRWQWGRDEIIELEKFYTGLLQHIKALSGIWRQAALGVKFAGDGNEPFQRLMDILGLNATSIDFFSRKAGTDDYVWNYYNYQGLLWLFFQPVWSLMQAQKSSKLAAVGLGSFTKLKIRELTFLKEREHLYGPVVDGDPELPLSETDGIRPFYEYPEGGIRRNYIHWLLQSTLGTIEKESFVNQEGKSVSPPRALLYMLLRQSLLNQVVRAGKSWLVAEKVADSVPAQPNLLNMKGNLVLADKDLLNVSLPGSAGGMLGENILHATRNPGMQGFHWTWWPVSETRRAMEKLADLPTARLERLFAEHIDLCTYRMDAWINGLFNHRLRYMRESIREEGRPVTEGNWPTYNRGIYIGAYGWLENLRPRTTPPRPVRQEAVPEELRKPEKGPILSDPANGGYVLSPSMNHAVAAAVLRNAYISHANQDNKSPFSVNLSSRRVRTATQYLEGMRNGQSLAALLGYQLERSLHDNPGKLELDQYIYALRDRFPYSSGKLAEVPDGTPAEVVEANNVVNGYDLLHFTNGKTYPYGLPVQPANPNGLPAPGTPQARAIAAEIDRLAESLDAIGDLALAESVYQVVQGNYERAGGMLQALAEGKTPPEADFVTTPRNGITLLHRAAFLLKPDASSSVPGWGSATARSAANAPVNHWLGGMLPAPDDIGFEITTAGGTKNLAFSDVFDLQPIDFVLMCGNHFGDLSSELERFLVFKIKKLENLADTDELAVDFRKNGGRTHSLYLLLPLLRSLRRALTESRPLHAQDLLTGTEAQTTGPGNPKGLLADIAGCRSRVLAVHDLLVEATDEAGAGLGGFFKTRIAGPFQDYFDDPDHVIDPMWAARLDEIREKLLALVPLALPEALPASVGGPLDRTMLETLVAQAEAVLNILKKRLKDVDDDLLLAPFVPAPDLEPAEMAEAIEMAASNYGRAAKILFNQHFTALQLFTAHNADELQACLGQQIEPNDLEMEKWLQGIGKVREKMGNLADLSTAADLLLDKELSLSPIQLPYDEDGSWIGKSFSGYVPRNDTVSIVLQAAESPDPAAPICGLLLDEWTEVVPEKEVNAGIAFHFNRPNAMPPQALLLAVPPQKRGHWQWDDLMAILHDTLDRAKMRAVEPDQLLKGPTFQTLPAVMTEFTHFNFRTLWAHNVILRPGVLISQSSDF